MRIQTLHGIVRGRTIELEEDLDAAEGAQVEVQVRLGEPEKCHRSPSPGK